MSDRLAIQIDQLWDDLVLGQNDRGQDPTLDPAMAQTVERVHALSQATTSPSARERARARVFTSQPSAEATALVPPAAITTLRRAPQTKSPVTAPRKRHIWRTWLPLAAALLVLLGGVVTYVAFAPSIDFSLGRNRGNEGVIPAVSESPDVPMLGANPGRTGEMGGMRTASPPGTAWTFNVPNSTQTPPIVSGGMIYIGMEGPSPQQPGAVTALDASDGSVQWTTPTEAGCSATLLYFAGMIYAVDDGGTVYALDTQTGREQWRLDLDGDPAYHFTWYSAPLIVDGTLVLASGSPLSIAASDDAVFVGRPPDDWLEGQPRVYAVDLQDRSVRWTVDGFPDDQSGLFAFRAGDGSVIWTAGDEPVKLAPSYRDGVVYYGGGTPESIVALDARTGDRQWSYDLGEAEAWDGWEGPSVDQRAIYLSTRTGDLIALDQRNGDELWRTQVATVGTAWTFQAIASPSIAGNTLFVASVGSALISLDAEDGSILWRAEVASASYDPVPPVIVQGMTYMSVYFDSESSTTLFALSTNIPP